MLRAGLTWQPAFSSSLHQVQFCIHKAQYVYRMDSAQSQGIHTEIMVRGESSGKTRESLPVRLFCVLGSNFSQVCVYATPSEVHARSRLRFPCFLPGIPFYGLFGL